MKHYSWILFIFLFPLVFVHKLNGERAGRQHAYVKRYTLSEYLQEKSKYESETKFSSKIIVNCGVPNRECLGGFCKLDYNNVVKYSNATVNFKNFKCILPQK